MAKKQDNQKQLKFSFYLALLTLGLVFGYFVQSFIEISKHEPFSVAIERLTAEPTKKSLGIKFDPEIKPEGKSPAQ